MAITRVQAQNGGGGTTNSQPVTLTGTISAGDLLVCAVIFNGAGSNHSPTITDNLNVGSWNLPGSLNQYPGGFAPQNIIGWIRVDTAGGSGAIVTPTNLGASDYCVTIVAQYTGFSTGHPTLVTADITKNNGNSATAAATGFTNSAAPELIVLASGLGGGGGYTGFTGSAFSMYAAGSEQYADLIESTSGNAISWGATLVGGSSQWSVLLAGFYDSPPASAAIAWIT